MAGETLSPEEKAPVHQEPEPLTEQELEKERATRQQQLAQVRRQSLAELDAELAAAARKAAQDAAKATEEGPGEATEEKEEEEEGEEMMRCEDLLALVLDSSGQPKVEMASCIEPYRQNFAVFDLDQSGHISRNELTGVLKALGEEVPKEKARGTLHPMPY